VAAGSLWPKEMVTLWIALMSLFFQFFVVSKLWRCFPIFGLSFEFTLSKRKKPIVFSHSAKTVQLSPTITWLYKV
jgi:hypothetical protein